MSGMPLSQAFLFLASVIILIVAIQRQHLHPFLAIAVVASAFGLAAGFSTGLLGKAFGTGFSQTIYSPGLVIVAAGFVGGLAEGTAAADRLIAAVGRWRWLGPTRITTLLGLIAGLGASPAAAFALLTPLLRALGGGAAPRREAVIVAPALAISAGHGLLLFSPVPIAAASILGAAWSRVALFGVPVAILLVVIGAAWTRWLPMNAATQPPIQEPPLLVEKRGGWSTIVLLLATAIPLLMLMVQSLGDVPSEPFGGGPAREMILGLGRPLILFLVALGIMIAGLWPLSRKLLADPAWSTRILGNVSAILLTVAAAGGLQRLCQETGMAELLGERLLGWHAGVLVPFLIAALMKTLQGSSLVAAITAAGMLQPLLLPLGLGDESGKALATLAIGAGAMTLSHVNDEYLWLVAASAGLSPLRALAAITAGTLVQGLVAVAALFILSVLFSGV